MGDSSKQTVENIEKGNFSKPTEEELEKARRNIRMMLKEMLGLQNDLIELHERAIHVRPTIWNLHRSRKQLTELQEEYAKLSEDVNLAIKVGHSANEFDESERFNGDLSGEAVAILSANEFRPVIEKHVDRVADRSQQVEAVLANRSRDITNRFALLISLIAIMISTLSIGIQAF